MITEYRLERKDQHGDLVFPTTTEERRWSWNAVFPVLKGGGGQDTLPLRVEVKNTKTQL